MSLIKNNYSIEQEFINGASFVEKKYGDWPNYTVDNLFNVIINPNNRSIVLVFISIQTGGEKCDKTGAWYHINKGTWKMVLECTQVDKLSWNIKNKNKSTEVITKDRKNKIHIIMQRDKYGTYKFECDKIRVTNFEKIELKK